MQQYKNFKSLNDQEREKWLVEFRCWLPELSKAERGEVPAEPVFRIGLPLLCSFSYCKAFAAETLRVKDYSRRFTTLRRLTEKVVADIKSISGESVNVQDNLPFKKHVGRPTREEAMARALFKQQQEQTKALTPNLFNGEKQQTQTDENPFISPTPTTPHGRTIAEVRWLLSPELARQTETLRALRSHFEDECATAKYMAAESRDPEEIKPHSQAAARYCEEIEHIYSLVDYELQSVYVRLKEDTAFIAEMANKSPYTNLQLRTILRPYWDKLSTEEKTARKAKEIAQIKSNDPAQAGARKKEEEKRAAVNNIVKYLRRTDRANTLKRINGMEKKLKELAELIGQEADVYLPLLDAARRDYEENIKPLDEAKQQNRSKKAE